MTSRLKFNPGRHTYTLDGKPIPGVTTTIRKSTDKPALVGAAARETALWAVHHYGLVGELGEDKWVAACKAAYRDQWNAAGKRGTLLHEAARQLVAGDPITPVGAEGNQWPDDVIRSAEQLAKFMDEWDAEPLISERPVYHSEHRWAGTLDLVAKVRDGRVLLLDYKTGSGVYPEASMQLAAYRHATHVQLESTTGLEDHPMAKVNGAAVVWVRPDGYDVIPVRSDVVVYQKFLHMLPVAAWVDWKPSESIGEPLPTPGVAS